MRYSFNAQQLSGRSLAQRRNAFAVAYALSGAAALIAETVLARGLAPLLGSGALGLAAAAAATLGGGALGALCGRPLARLRSPWRALALLEALSAATSMALPLWLPLLRSALAPLALEAPGRLAVAALLLAPLAALGGASLPAAAGRSPPPHYAALLYGSNALGAAAGALGAGFLFVPAFGLLPTAAIAATLQLAVAAAALWLRPAEPAPAPVRSALRPSLWMAAALAGCAGLTLQFAWTRLLLPWLDGGTRGLSLVLALYLLGLGLGALAGRGRAALWLCVAGTAAALTASLALRRLDGQQLFTASAVAWAALCIVPATFAFGAATRDLFAQVHGDGAAVGGLLGAAGLGSVAGAFLAPIVITTLFGTQQTLGAGAALACTAALLLLPPRQWIFALGGLSVLLLPRHPPVRQGLVPLLQLSGPVADVEVDEEPTEGARLLLFNGVFSEGGTSLEARYGQALQGHIPLLLHPGPRSATFLGVGTGISLAAAAAHRGVALSAAEISPEALMLLPYFAPYNDGIERATLYQEDARVALGRSGLRDVIVGELFYPWQPFAGGLYSVEQARTVRAHLQPGGLDCQWLPLYLMPLSAVAAVAAALRTVYPHTALVLGQALADQPQAALCGSDRPLEVPADVDARVAALPLDPEINLARFWGQPREALASLVLLGDEGVAALAGAAPPETDLRPRIEFLSGGASSAIQARAADGLQRLIAMAQPRAIPGARLALLREALALTMGHFDDALAAQHEAEAQAPWLGESALAGLRLEGELRHLRRYAEAEALLDRALQFFPSDAETLYLKGTLRLRGEDAAAAEPFLRRALAADERCGRCAMLLGRALGSLGRTDDARAAYQTALQLDPDNAQAKAALGQ